MTRPFRWSVRRELWENRSIYLAPLCVAGVAMFGFMISTIGMPHRRRATLLLPIEKQRVVIGQPYDAVALMIFVTAIIVGIFYCLDALYGERRERTILFWKSLPVSDRTTVLSKMTVPVVILPAIVFTLVLATQFLMLIWTTIVLAPSGLAWSTFARLGVAWRLCALPYFLITLTLWHLPLYAWLLLVSGWAKRATFLWAVLPLAAIAALEKIAIGTTYFGQFLRSRLIGFAKEAAAFGPKGQLNSFSQLTPGNYLLSPGLWVGFVLAAIFVAAAVKLRRSRGPV